MESANTNATWALKQILKILGEPLAWHLEASDVTEFVRSQGFSCDQVVDGHMIRARFLADLPSQPLHLGEFVVLSSVNRGGS